MFHSYISKVDIHATAIRAAQGVGASIRYQAAPDPAEVSPERPVVPWWFPMVVPMVIPPEIQRFENPHGKNGG